MKRFLIGSTLLFALALALLLALLAQLRRAELPAAQIAPAAALRIAAGPGGSANAFARLWLLPWDLSPEVTAAIASEDAARINALLASGQPIEPNALVSRAEGRYPRAPDLLDGAFVCGPLQPRCLARLRAQPQAAERALAGQHGVIERLAGLVEDDHYHHPFADDPRAPALPALSGAQTALATRIALDFLAGRQFAALEANCRQIGAWRRIGAAHDQFHVQLLAAAALRRHGELLAEMLAELPLEAPLPGVCAEALAAAKPVGYPLCAAARRDALRRSEDLRQRVEAPGLPWYRRLAGRLMQEPRRTEAWTALALAPACDGRLDEALRGGTVPDWPLPGQRPPRWHCLSAPLSCHHAGRAIRDLAGHHLRLLDHQQRIAALGELLELRRRLAEGQTPSQATAALEHLEHEPRSDTLLLRLRAPSSGELEGWRLPWPGRGA